MKIVEIVRFHQYHDTHYDPSLPDPGCAQCYKPLGHTVTLIVKDEDGNEHEIHADCKTTGEQGDIRC